MASDEISYDTTRSVSPRSNTTSPGINQDMSGCQDRGDVDYDFANTEYFANTEFSALDVFKEAVNESVTKVAKLVTEVAEKLDKMEKRILEEIGKKPGNLHKNRMSVLPSLSADSGPEDSSLAARSSRNGWEPARTSTVSKSSSMNSQMSFLFPIVSPSSDHGTRDGRVSGKNVANKKDKGKYVHRGSTDTSRTNKGSTHGVSSMALGLHALEKALDDQLIEKECCRTRRMSISHHRAPRHSDPSVLDAEHRFESQGSHLTDETPAERVTQILSTPEVLSFPCESQQHRSSVLAISRPSSFIVRCLSSIRELPMCGSQSTSSNSWCRTSSEKKVAPSTSMSTLSHGRSKELVQEAMDLRRSNSRGSSMVSPERNDFCADDDDDDDDDYTPLEFLPSLWLCMSGIVNWSGKESTHELFVKRFCTTLNRSVMISLMLSILAVCMYHLANLRNGALEETCDMIMCVEHFLPAVVALGLGCFLGLVSLFIYADHILGHMDSVLTMHLQYVGVLETWSAGSHRDMLRILLVWLCWMGMCVYTSLGWELHVTRISLHLAVVAVTTNVFCAFVFYMLQVCRGLFLMLDSFCCEIVGERSCENAAKRWNTLMAIQKRVCSSVARTYIILLTSAIAATVFPMTFGSHAVAILPGACALLLMLWVSFSISDVTSRCDRVPTFINTLDFNGNNFDYHRQYVVEYVIHSRAGFYMFDVRVTAEAVVKTAYVGGVIAVAFASNRASI